MAKRILFILLAVVMAIATALPVLAVSVTTGVQIQTGGGTIPLVKCKWETPDADPATPGTQVNPPMTFGGTTPVTYWAVVTDAEDNGKVAQVYVDVFHPAGPPEDGSFKYEVPMNLVTDKLGAGLAAFEAALKANLVTFSPGITADDVRYELTKCTAEVWSGTADLSYHQPCGDYLVKAFAIDTNGNLSAALNNTLTYVCGTGVEIDFTAVDYGSVSIGKGKWIAGDVVWGTADKPTVRNIGNTNAYIWIKQDDMGMGKDVTGMWNVQFDARMGNDPANEVLFDPMVNTMLPNYLPLCNMDELDFSIHVKKAVSGRVYTGTMWITSTKAPF
ncbi:MAG: hypothetical protein Q7O66_17285 [Dehalococcoidia bacterium]|nr:hypothetical protein [Dehalococcoidia bacterium]